MNNGSNERGGFPFKWLNAAAINRITLLLDVGNLAIGARATLYGLL